MSLRARRGLTRWELAIGVGVALATAAWVRPRIARATFRTHRAEAGLVLEALAEHVAALPPTTGALGDLGAFPRGEDQVDSRIVPWTGGPPGFVPPLPGVRCAYRVDRVAEGLELVATCDVDGDGVRSVSSLVPGRAARSLTPDEVY